MFGRLNQALAFLTEAFHAGRAYSIINIYRSMLSTTIKLGPSAEKYDIGKHPQIVKLMAGIYNSRPPIPKYNRTWDPTLVLNYPRSLDNENVSLLQQGQKLATLLPLCTMLICGEIASMSLQSISFSSTGLSFSLLKPRKTQHSGPLQTFSLRIWIEDPITCPVICMQNYLQNTATLRTGTSFQYLIIGTTSPHKLITSTSIGRCIKTLLAQSGSHTNQFSAHSV